MRTRTHRRGFAALSAAAAVLMASGVSAAQPSPALPAFDAEFLWGVASSGFQSEGHAPDSNWSRFIAAGGTADPYRDSVDFARRYISDIDLAQLLTWRGEHDAAVPLMDEALALMHELGATDDAADLICRRAWTRLLSGDRAGARDDYERAAATARRTGMPETRAAAYVGMANLARLSGDLDTAREWCERALTECPGGSFAAETVRAMALISLGWLAVAEGRPEEAAGLHRSALLTGRQWHAGDVVAFALEGLAGVVPPDQAATLLGAAAGVRGTSIAGDPDVSSVRARVRESLGADGFERAYATGLAMNTQKALTTAGLAD
jgi:tetratricopeptide (TPR) repeat protein